jgi:hypothetical protein
MTSNEDEYSFTKGDYNRVFNIDPDEPWGDGEEEAESLLNDENRQIIPFYRRMPESEAVSTYNESRFQKTGPGEDSRRWATTDPYKAIEFSNNNRSEMSVVMQIDINKEHFEEDIYGTLISQVGARGKPDSSVVNFEGLEKPDNYSNGPPPKDNAYNVGFSNTDLDRLRIEDADLFF